MLVRPTACLVMFLKGPIIGSQIRIRSGSVGGCLGLFFARVCQNRNRRCHFYAGLSRRHCLGLLPFELVCAYLTGKLEAAR